MESKQKKPEEKDEIEINIPGKRRPRKREDDEEAIKRVYSTLIEEVVCGRRIPLKKQE